MEKQLQAAYDAELQAALQKEQQKWTAAEQADLDNLKATLQTQIKSELQAGCLTFDDGSYFCVNPGEATGTYAAPAPYFKAYATKDPQKGNEEIFIQEGGRVTQITRTNYDNIQPVWNKDASLVAWQGMMNDRWQIFLYDRATGATHVLSSGDVNNINPTIEGRRVAWQGWDNNWEIYLATPSSTDWSTEEITHDPWANIEPQLAGGLLAWQSYQNNSWQIFVDDLASGAVSQVSAGGGANTNPHFLLTWNNEENGKTQAFQYDVSSGEVSPLGAPPVPTPASLPPAPSDQNNATLPAGGASTSTATSSKSQTDGNDPLAN